MVHTVPGTANAIGGIVNAARSNIPMLFSAGRTPLTEGNARGSRDGSIHWAQESFDQAAMLREWVKWDYELRHGADLEAVVDRAFAISESAPAGPVYLTLPREVLAEELQGITYNRDSRQQKSGERPAAPDLIAAAARMLCDASNPLLVTRGGGERPPGGAAPGGNWPNCWECRCSSRGPSTPTSPRAIPSTAAGNQGPPLREADAVVVLEADVPWTPKTTRPGGGLPGHRHRRRPSFLHLPGARFSRGPEPGGQPPAGAPRVGGRGQGSGCGRNLRRG